MAIIPQPLFNDFELASMELSDIPRWKIVEPPQLPVRIIDLERVDGCMDMDHHMGDPCPECGAYNWRLGDWACYGMCWPCVHAKGLDDLS
jgi:hypothetical protein